MTEIFPDPGPSLEFGRGTGPCRPLTYITNLATLSGRPLSFLPPLTSGKFCGRPCFKNMIYVEIASLMPVMFFSTIFKFHSLSNFIYIYSINYKKRQVDRQVRRCCKYSSCMQKSVYKKLKKRNSR